MSRFWFIPFTHILLVASLYAQNTTLMANDKAVMAFPFYARGWFIVLVLLLTILLEIGFEFYSRKLEEI